MRLGGPVFGDASDPEKWIALLRQQNYRAAYCPLDNKASQVKIKICGCAGFLIEGHSSHFDTCP